MRSVGDITGWLDCWSEGDPRGIEHALLRLYGDLRRLAADYMARERSDHTLQPTALVHEAVLRLLAQHRRPYRDRGHFVAMAATMMRRVLIDHARRRQSQRRASAWHDGGVADTTAAMTGPALPGTAALGHLEWLAIDRALDALATVDRQQARLVELRYFLGLSVAETAAALGLSPRTVKRRWQTARVWLYDHLTPSSAQ